MSPRGGVRKGAGRPKGEETKVMRIPVGKIRDVMAVIEEDSSDIPLYSAKVQAGLPSPADDYIEGMVNLNALLIDKASNTFMVRATGDSMIDVGIYNDDTLIVDKSIPPSNGKIVIAAIDGELTVKRLDIGENGRVRLLPENSDYLPIEITAENEFSIWGVVTSSIRRLY